MTINKTIGQKKKTTRKEVITKNQIPNIANFIFFLLYITTLWISRV